jgi:DNA-binding transcriptional regulator YiaG
MKTMTLKKYYGLEYVTVTGIPVRKTAHGNVVDMDTGLIEKAVAKLIIQEKVPLRGIEFNFIRKVLGMSLGRIGAELGISAPAVLKWERAKKKRLDPINEVAVRALMAEKLGVRIPGKFSLLLGDAKTPEKLTVNAMNEAA